MFGYVVKHHVKKANIELENNAKLTPLTMASKLGRIDIFKEIIELQSIVSTVDRALLLQWTECCKYSGQSVVSTVDRVL